MSGYTDLQINGYAGVDFNDDAIGIDDLQRACQMLRHDGIDTFLPTIITDAVDTMERRLKRLVDLREQDPKIAAMIVGLHVEGPFLNPLPGFIGAHPTQHARPADPEIAKRLLEAAGGLLRILTLAPECDTNAATTAMLTKQNVIVSAGHTDATLADLQRSIDAGLRMFTHLGNGCPVQMHRHDNIVQRVLSLSDRLHIGLIADSHHIPLFALHNYLRLIPPKQIVLTTDAIAAAGLGPGSYPLAGRMVRVAENDAPRFDDSGQLAGSAATMTMMVRHLETIGIPQSRIEEYCGGNARRILGSLT